MGQYRPLHDQKDMGNDLEIGLGVEDSEVPCIQDIHRPNLDQVHGINKGYIDFPPSYSFPTLFHLLHQRSASRRAQAKHK